MCSFIRFYAIPTALASHVYPSLAESTRALWSFRDFFFILWGYAFSFLVREFRKRVLWAICMLFRHGASAARLWYFKTFMQIVWWNSRFSTHHQTCSTEFPMRSICLSLLSVVRKSRGFSRRSIFTLTFRLPRYLWRLKGSPTSPTSAATLFNHRLGYTVKYVYK